MFLLSILFAYQIYVQIFAYFGDNIGAKAHRSATHIFVPAVQAGNRIGPKQVHFERFADRRRRPLNLGKFAGKKLAYAVCFAYISQLIETF